MTTNNFRVTPLWVRLQQVMMTYLTRPFLAWACGLGSILLLTIAAFIVSEYEGQKPLSDLGFVPIVQIIGLPAFIFSLLLAMHAKWQFVNPVARLVPSYRAPHIGLLASLAFGVLGAFPLLFGMKLGLSPIGLAAMAIAIASPVLWGAHNNSGFVAFFSTAIFLSAMYPPVAQFWFDPNRVYGVNHLGILLLGWGFVVVWLRGLTTLHEERSDYNIPPIAAQFGRASRSERAEQRKLIARSMKKIPLQGWLADRSIDQELAGPKPSPQQLLRHGFNALSAEQRALSFLLFVFTVFVAIVLVAISLFAGADPHNTRQGIKGLLMMPLFFAFIMPGSMLSQFFINRRPQMEAELLRPMTRENYVTDLIHAGIRDAAILMVAFLGATLALVSLFAPEMITLFSVTAIVAASVACNFFVASFSILCASFRLGVSRVFLPMLSIPLIALVGLGFTGIWWKMTKGNPEMLEQVIWAVVALGLASVLPLLGLFFLRLAKRRWMNVELG